MSDRALRALVYPFGEALERGAHQLIDGCHQDLRPRTCFGGEDAQQLGLAVELVEDVASGEDQFGSEISDGGEHTVDLAERVQSRELALDARGENRFLALEMVI